MINFCRQGLPADRQTWKLNPLLLLFLTLGSFQDLSLKLAVRHIGWKLVKSRILIFIFNSYEFRKSKVEIERAIWSAFCLLNFSQVEYTAHHFWRFLRSDSTVQLKRNSGDISFHFFIQGDWATAILATNLEGAWYFQDKENEVLQGKKNCWCLPRFALLHPHLGTSLLVIFTFMPYLFHAYQSFTEIWHIFGWCSGDS